MRSTYVSYSSRSAVASPETTRLISCKSFTGLRDSYAASSIVHLLTMVDGKGLSSSLSVLAAAYETVPASAREPKRVLRPPLARPGSAAAGTIRLARRLDPQKRVDEPVAGSRSGRRTKLLTG